MKTKDLIAGIRKEIAEEERRISELYARCNHVILFNHADVAMCDECGRDFGWYCPVNERCEYDHGDENCVHCGEPSERK
jgi:hypothetical protein